MDSHDIRSIARQQHRRGVALVELDDGRHRVRIDIDAGDEQERTSAVVAKVATPSGRGDDSVLVTSEGLGVFRRSHPSHTGSPVVSAGESVTEGRPLALLQLGDVFTSIDAPIDGTVERVLAEEGQRVDHGMPLFTLIRAGR